jgi:hypothetical protein
MVLAGDVLSEDYTLPARLPPRRVFCTSKSDTIPEASVLSADHIQVACPSHSHFTQILLFRDT